MLDRAKEGAVTVAAWLLLWAMMPWLYIICWRDLRAAERCGMIEWVPPEERADATCRGHWHLAGGVGVVRAFGHAHDDHGEHEHSVACLMRQAANGVAVFRWRRLSDQDWR